MWGKDFIMGKPKITVVTVTRNAEDVLEETILSVTNQKYKNIEYIVIDGVSSDNTLNIIKKHENNIHHWISEPDLGIYYAMNKGIDFASGAWVIFMNAGDVLVDDYVIDKIFSASDYKDFDVIYGNRIYIDKHGNEVLQKTTSDLNDMYKKDIIYHQASFVRLGEMKRKFNTTLMVSSDYEFFLRLFRLERKFKYIDIEVCRFAFGGFSASSERMTFQNRLDVIQALMMHGVSIDIIRENRFFKLLCGCE